MPTPRIMCHMGVRDCIDADSTVRHLPWHCAFFSHKAPLMLGDHPTKHFLSPSREISKEMYITLRTTRMNLTDVAKSVRAEVWCASREIYSRHNLSAASNKSKVQKAQAGSCIQRHAGSCIKTSRRVYGAETCKRHLTASFHVMYAASSQIQQKEV